MSEHTGVAPLLERMLSDLGHNSRFEFNSDEARIALRIVAACSQTMLPYWETSNPRDDKMERVVAAIFTWNSDPSNGNLSALSQRIATVGKPLQPTLSPIPDMPEPIGSDCPADFAGDSIVAAANAILQHKKPAFAACVRDTLANAAESISRLMGERDPEDETTDHWSRAKEQLRETLVRQLG